MIRLALQNILIAMLALVLWGSFAWAEDNAIVEVDAKTTSIDLANLRTPIAAERQKISIQGPKDPQATELEAKGPGPTYYWSLIAVQSKATTDLEMSLTMEPQRFAGSGLLKIVPAGSYPVNVVGTTQALVQADRGDVQVFNFTIKPNQIFNIAVETTSANFAGRLWASKALDAQFSTATFINGAVLGMLLLIIFGLLSIYGFRPHVALLAGWFFALTSLAFIVQANGFLPSTTLSFAKLNISPSTLRAIVETFLAEGLAFCVMVFSNVQKRLPAVAIILWFVLALLAANLVYSFIEPNVATSVARFGFGLMAVCGFVFTAIARRSTKAIVDRSLVFWSALLAWVVYAGVLTQNNTTSIWLVVGLILVLLLLCMALLRYIFMQGLAAKTFITDSSRRSLALSGAMHYMWDWQPNERHLDVGEDLPKALGYDLQEWRLNARNHFYNIIHPLDAPIYNSEVEDTEIVVGQVIDLELRLRHAKGTYQWFGLRARAIPGVQNQLDRCIGTLTDISRFKETEERLVVDAVHDPVTGLPSRALFTDRLERELSKPVSLPVRILLVDIDRFKTLNDALGHDYGDRLLLLAGGRILECLAPDESVARISGSQFAVLMIEAIARRTVGGLAGDIAKALSAAIELPGQDVFLSASIGVSNASARGVTAAMLQQQAASALLEARRRGGAVAVQFDASMKDERAAQLALEADLRRAMSGDEIEVQYQPISHLGTMDIAGFEALARWRHPNQGLLPPAQFIDMAEQAGMISEIGQIVLAQAARQLGIWQRVLRHDRPFFVSVNISPSHLLETNFLEQVQVIISREGLSAGSLKIEVTESVVMRHPERAAKLFDRLKSLGVGLACDDFGTGFSSLSSLRTLPFDTLKIDRSFIAPESFDQRSGVIISTITDLAHSLGMVVVAEGIETQAQVDRLAELGCDLGQGYLIGSAMPAAQVTDTLAVLPRIVANHMAQFKKPTYEVPNAPAVGYAPLAPRRTAEPENKPEELPSIFAVSKDDAPRKAKAKVVKKAKKK